MAAGECYPGLHWHVNPIPSVLVGLLLKSIYFSMYVSNPIRISSKDCLINLGSFSSKIYSYLEDIQVFFGQNLSLLNFSFTHCAGLCCEFYFF